MGTWGTSIAPFVGAAYDVEFNLDASLDETERTEADGRRELAMDGDHVLVRGLIGAVDDDGVVVLRLAPDCIILIESLEAHRVKEPLGLKLSQDALQIFPFGC